MAKVVEQIIAVKFSRIVKDSDSDTNVLTQEQVENLTAVIPEIMDQTLDDNAIVVEVIALE